MRSVRVRSSLAVGIAMASALVASRAGAQERLHLEELGDEQLAHTTLQREGDAVEPWRARLFAAGGADAQLGPLENRSTSLAAGLGLGAWGSSTRFLQIYSEAIVPDTGALQGGLAWRGVEGYHRARVHVGFGPVEEKETGLDLEASGSLAHATPGSTSFLRPEIGPYSFRDASAQATVWPRIGSEKDSAYVVPFTVGTRRVEIDAADAMRGFTSQRVSSGIGLRDYAQHTASGWFEVLGAGYERARFDVGAPGTLGGAEKIDVRALHFDRWITSADDDIDLNLTTELGGAWVWDRATKQDTSTFMFRLGWAMRIWTDDDHKHDSFTTGFSATRDAGWLADGAGLTRQWRLETPLDVSLMDGRVGGSLRMAATYLDVPGGALPIREGWRATVATEWFIAPVGGVQVGAHHVTTNACIAGGDEWCHTIGAFVRLTGAWAEKREQDEERKKEEEHADPPPPPRAPPPPGRHGETWFEDDPLEMPRPR